MMILTIWVFCALALILYPLLSTAIPTDLTFSLDEALKLRPHETLSNTGDKGQCIEVPWTREGVISFDNSSNNLVIFIETVMGVLLCFVTSSDMRKMMPETLNSRPDEDPSPQGLSESEYQSLFFDRMLGIGGELIVKMRQLIRRQKDATETTCPPPFEVFGIQMAAFGQKARLHRTPLLQKIGFDLKAELNAVLDPVEGQLDWKIPVYPLNQNLMRTVALSKSVEDDIHIAKIWFTGTYSYEGHRHPVADIELDFPIGFVDPFQPDALAFGAAEIKYRLEGKFYKTPKKLGPQPIPTKALVMQLYEDSQDHDRALYTAEQRLWLKYNDQADTIQCGHVPWSAFGSLLGFINDETAPVLMIQASSAAILCYIPVEKWERLTDLWGWNFHRGKHLGYTENIKEYEDARDSLLQPLHATLEKVRDAPNPSLQNIPQDGFSILGSQFSASYYKKATLFKLLVKDVLGKVSKMLQAAVVNPSVKSDSTVRLFLFSKDTAKKAAPGSEFRYIAMWLISSTTELWIWTMGRAGEGGGSRKPHKEGKSRLVDVDLSRPMYEYKLPETDLDS